MVYSPFAWVKTRGDVCTIGDGGWFGSHSDGPQVGPIACVHGAHLGLHLGILKQLPSPYLSMVTEARMMIPTT